MSAIKISVVTPEKAVLDTTADFVVLPMFDGERGIGAGHSAFVGQLGPGEFRFTTAGTTTRYFHLAREHLANTPSPLELLKRTNTTPR